MNSFKEFSSFNDGLSEIVNIVPEIKSICESIFEETGVSIDKLTPKDLANQFTKIVMNDFPYVDFRSPAVSISYREVGFKSRSVLSFGWKYISTGSGSLCYSFRISFFSHSESVKEIEAKLAELGWEQSGEKHNFFPYRNKPNKFKKDKPNEKDKKQNFKPKASKKQEHVEEVEPVENQPAVVAEEVVAEEIPVVEQKQEDVKNTSSEY